MSGVSVTSLVKKFGTTVAVAGVDIIRSNKGPLLLEVNSSPGLEGIERATGIDIANAMIQAIERKLVDAIAFRDQLEDEVSDRVGAPVEISAIRDGSPEVTTWSTEPYIAEIGRAHV